MADVVYQMIHRAASAVDTKLSPSLLYLHFHDTETPAAATTATYKADLERLYQKLGRPSGFPFYVAEQPMARTNLFGTIQGLEKSHESTSAAVKEALLAGPLFEYGVPAIERVE